LIRQRGKTSSSLSKRSRESKTGLTGPSNTKVTLKKFYKWLRGLDGKGVYPEEVAWIRTTMKNGNNTLPTGVYPLPLSTHRKS